MGDTLENRNPRETEVYEDQETVRKHHDYLKSLYDMSLVNYRYLQLQQSGMMCPWFHQFTWPRKLKDNSISLFEKGNDLYRKHQYIEALKLFTQSLAHAEEKNRLVLAYEGRTRCLWNLKLYNAVIVDCNRALPLRKTVKLTKRRKDAQILAKPHDFMYHDSIPFYGEENQHPEIQSARNCLEICTSSNPNERSSIRAATSISYGDIVSVERPYACVPLESMFYNCHHCFELCFNMIPCQNCPNALYCSEKCREEAFSKYHVYECIVKPQLEALHIDAFLALALRTAIIGRDEYDQVVFIRNERSSEGTEVYRSDRLKEIMKMKEDGRVMSDKDLSIAAYIFKILRDYTYFFKSPLEAAQFETIFLRLVRILFRNTSDIPEIRRVKVNSSTDITIPNLGCGVYPFASLFEHSCAPNLLKIFYGNVLVLVAIKDIKSGEKCSVAYGNCGFAALGKQIRQPYLKTRYDFICECPACKNDWPLPVIQECERVEDKHRRLEYLFQKIMKLLREEPDPNDARLAIQINATEFKPFITELPIYILYHTLSIVCHSFFGNRNLVWPWPASL